MSFKKECLRVYLVADSCQPELLEKTEAALKGGVTLVQLRMKEASGREFYEEALKMKKLCNVYGVPFVINDRIDIALAVGADGVHIGQSDLPASVARALLGDGKIIGVTAKNSAEILEAAKSGADYVGAGAFTFTATKTDAEMMTLEEFKGLSEMSPLPVVGIGGIAPQTAGQVIEAGAAGVAVSSAILGHSNPEVGARNFAEVLKLSQ
jgi:thiamine-phosphate pyrophosphorylase